MFIGEDGKLSLFRKIVIPIYVIITVIVTIFTITSCIVIINLQNSYNNKILEQSMGYTYKNVSQQLYNINSFLYYMTVNQDIENILDKNSNEITDIVNGNIQIKSIMDRISFLTLAADFDDSNTAKVSYITSIIVDESSNLYPIAISNFTASTGLYKNDSVKEQEWYIRSIRNQTGPVWWVNEANGYSMIYSAIKKVSIRDGRKLGVMVVALDMRNIKSLLEKSIFNDEGYYVLLDEAMEVVYSGSKNKDNFSEYIEKLNKNKDSLLVNVHNMQNIVMYDTFKNGWKLVLVVPEGTVKKYMVRIIACGFISAILCIFIAGYITGNTTKRITRPIKDIVNVMKKAEVGKYKDRLTDKSTIYEISQLYNGYNTMLYKIDNLINDVYIKDIQQKQAQLHLLQSQINPHFLYNTLDIINCMAITKEAKDISHIVLSLANVFRYGLNKGKQFIPLHEEIKQVMSYIDIQKFMNPGLSVEYSIDDTITDLYVINLIIQPLVENAVIHGFRNMVDNCMIWIDVRKNDGNDIVISVKDNGCGVEAEKMNNILNAPKKYNKGYGVYNIDKRIKLSFGENYGLRYLVVDRGTLAEIYLPGLKERPDEE